jgi:signal transduction histidine kinase
MSNWTGCFLGPGKSVLLLKWRIGGPRVSMALQTIGHRSEAVQQFIWTTTLLGLAAAILFAMGLAVLWSNPLRRITAMARSLSQGDLSARVSVSGNDEMALLARSLNEMRMHLAGQLETIDRQRRTLQSLLAQLREGVIVADAQGKILLINPTAAELLGVSPGGVEALGVLVGRPVEQCVTDHEIQKMLLSASDKSGSGPAERNATAANPPAVQEAQIRLNDAKRGAMILLAQASDIVLPDFDPGHQIHGTGKEPSVGRMLVLTNITELTRTIQVKSDFASNASHELRTPLSAIRAAVETMEALDFAKDSESAKRFLAMIDRHSRRMEEMVSDLLDLTRLESSSTRFKWHRLNLPDLLKEVQQRYQDRLDKGKLDWVTRVEPGLTMMDGNPYLLHLILGNLLDNAIKFTGAGGSVSVFCRQRWKDATRKGDVTFAITDTGCGIPVEEQARVFERFYQVEQARSGTWGTSAETRGTGLGLSIVKHAVTAMGGEIDLKSTPGQGTKITVSIPQSA